MDILSLLAEHIVHIDGVVGSSPTVTTGALERRFKHSGAFPFLVKLNYIQKWVVFNNFSTRDSSNLFPRKELEAFFCSTILQQSAIQTLNGIQLLHHTLMPCSGVNRFNHSGVFMPEKVSDLSRSLPAFFRLSGEGCAEIVGCAITPD